MVAVRWTAIIIVLDRLTAATDNDGGPAGRVPRARRNESLAAGRRCAAASAGVEVGEDVLHVVAVLQGVDQPEDLPGTLFVELDLVVGTKYGLGGVVVDAGVLEGRADRDGGRLGRSSSKDSPRSTFGTRVEHGTQTSSSVSSPLGTMATACG